LIANALAGHSQQTVDFYARKLKPLIAYLEDMPVEQVTLSDLRRFVTHLRARKTRWDDHPSKRQKAGGLSEATIAGIVRATRRLFGFLIEEGVIAESPTARLNQPQKRRACLAYQSTVEGLCPAACRWIEKPSKSSRRSSMMILPWSCCKKKAPVLGREPLHVVG
jgi:site-specific recombinase XerD